jgi:predicted metal-dependent hydrolase
MPAASENVAHRGGITPRAPGFDFREVPRRWFGGLALPTHISNGANLLFPMGERFFVRAVRHFEKVIADDPALLADVRAFYRQEGHHAGTHERYFEALEAQGFSVRPFLKAYRTLAFDGLERATSAELHLAATAALEHFTAIMAEGALRQRLLDAAHPAMRDLLLWHAAEEIEHKSVAFDVLQRVNPSYALRMAGLFVATVTLAGFWFAATTMLLAQDDALSLESFREVTRARKAQGVAERSIARDVFWAGIQAYVRRDFHPTQLDNDALARDYLATAFAAG